MKYAIIGCGKFGKYHLKTLLEEGKDVKYVCNKTDSKFKDIKNDYRGEYSSINNTQFITDVSIILNDPEISIVTIATGPKEHYELTKACLTAKKHVVCEKPFVFSMDEVKELYELSKSNNLILFIHYSDVFSPKLSGDGFYATIRKGLESDYAIDIFYQNFGLGPDRGNEYSTIWDYGSQAAAFAYSCGIVKYTGSDVYKFDSVLYGFISKFENKNMFIACQFGNAFSDRQRGLTVKMPEKLASGIDDNNGVVTYMINLKKEKTLPFLYADVEYYVNDYSKYITYYEYWLNLSLFVTAFCHDLEASINQKKAQ